MNLILSLIVATFLWGCSNRKQTPPHVEEETEVIDETQPPIPEPIEEKPPVVSDLDLKFKSSADASEYLDLTSYASECKAKECLFADLETQDFVKNADNEYESRSSFLSKLRSGSPAIPSSKAMRVGVIDTSFDLATSVVFGAEDRLGELELDQKCQQNISLENNQRLPDGISLDKIIEDGTEYFDAAEIDNRIVFGNLKISGTATDGKISAGSEVSVNYQKFALLGRMSAAFQDFESISGKYILSVEATAASTTLRRIWASVRSIFQEAAAYAVNFPEGYPIPPPANGYQYDPLHNTCNTSAPRIGSPEIKSYRNLAAYCSSEHSVSACCEIGRGCPTEWPVVERKYQTGKPMTDYVSLVRSRRVVSGAGTIDCAATLPSLASFYGITTSWMVTAPNVQWFVKDSAWPGCGGYSCPDKTMRSSAADSIAANVEPPLNYCVDRWQGLDYNTYLGTLQTECQNTEVFRKAVLDRAASDADIAFATSCNANADCKNAIMNLPTIRNLFPIETLQQKVQEEENALKAAKIAAASYLIKDRIFTIASVRNLQGLVAFISKGIDRAEEIKNSTTPRADWNGGAHRVHGLGTIVGFTSPSESRATLAEYDRLLSRIRVMTAPTAGRVGCGFTATGRYRKYINSELMDVSLNTAEQPLRSFTTTLRKDYIAE